MRDFADILLEENTVESEGNQGESFAGTEDFADFLLRQERMGRTDESRDFADVLLEENENAEVSELVDGEQYLKRSAPQTESPFELTPAAEKGREIINGPRRQVEQTPSAVSSLPRGAGLETTGKAFAAAGIGVANRTRAAGGLISNALSPERFRSNLPPMPIAGLNERESAELQGRDTGFGRLPEPLPLPEVAGAEFASGAGKLVADLPLAAVGAGPGMAAGKMIPMVGKLPIVAKLSSAMGAFAAQSGMVTALEGGTPEESVKAAAESVPTAVIFEIAPIAKYAKTWGKSMEVGAIKDWLATTLGMAGYEMARGETPTDSNALYNTLFASAFKALSLHRSNAPRDERIRMAKEAADALSTTEAADTLSRFERRESKKGMDRMDVMDKMDVPAGEKRDFADVLLAESEKGRQRNAIQEPGTTEMDVRESPRNGEALGERDAWYEDVAGEVAPGEVSAGEGAEGIASGRKSAGEGVKLAQEAMKQAGGKQEKKWRGMETEELPTARKALLVSIGDQWQWERPNETVLAGPYPDVKTAHQNAPEGYLHLDDAYNPIRELDVRREEVLSKPMQAFVIGGTRSGETIYDETAGKHVAAYTLKMRVKASEDQMLRIGRDEVKQSLPSVSEDEIIGVQKVRDPIRKTHLMTVGFRTESAAKRALRDLGETGNTPKALGVARETGEVSIAPEGIPEEVVFNGSQERPKGKTPLRMYTDKQTRTTFSVDESAGQTVAGELAKARERYAGTTLVQTGKEKTMTQKIRAAVKAEMKGFEGSGAERKREYERRVKTGIEELKSQTATAETAKMEEIPEMALAGETRASAGKKIEATAENAGSLEKAVNDLVARTGAKVRVRIRTEKARVAAQEATKYPEGSDVRAAGERAVKAGETATAIPKRAEINLKTGEVTLYEGADLLDAVHEVAHYFREKTALFTMAERSAILDRFPKDASGEEFARTAEDWYAKNGTEAAKPRTTLQRAFRKFMEFLKNVGDTLRLRKLTVDDVYGRIYRGEVGEKQAEARRMETVGTEKAEVRASAGSEFRFDRDSTKNEGRIEIRDRALFEKTGWSREKSDTPGVSYVIGTNAKTGQRERQSVRFDKSLWVEKTAGRWWEQNKPRETGVRRLETVGTEKATQEGRVSEEKGTKRTQGTQRTTEEFASAKRPVEGIESPETMGGGISGALAGVSETVNRPVRIALEKTLAGIKTRTDRIVSKLPEGTRRFIRKMTTSEFSQTPEIKATHDFLKRELAEGKNELSALYSMIVRDAKNPAEMLAADMVMRGTRKQAYTKETMKTMRPRLRAAVRAEMKKNFTGSKEEKKQEYKRRVKIEINNLRNLSGDVERIPDETLKKLGVARDKVREFVQQFSRDGVALGLPFNEKLMQGEEFYYPDIYERQKPKPGSEKGRKPGGGRVGYTDDELSRIHRRTGDCYVVREAKTKQMVAAFDTAEEAKTFLNKHQQNYSVTFWAQNAKGKMEKTTQSFPTRSERDSYVEKTFKAGDEYKLADGISRKELEIRAPLTHEQKRLIGLSENLADNFKRGLGSDKSLVAKTRFFDALYAAEGKNPEMFQSAEEHQTAPNPLFRAVKSLNLGVPENIKNPRIQELLNGWVEPSLASDLVGLFGKRGLLNETFWKIEQNWFRANVTYRNPFRHAKQFAENELTGFIADSIISGDLVGRAKSGWEMWQWLRGKHPEGNLRTFLEETDIPGSDLIHLDLMDMIARDIREADFKNPNDFHKTLMDKIAETSVGKAAGWAERAAKTAYHIEDMLYKWQWFDGWMKRGHTAAEAERKVMRYFIDWTNRPRIVQWMRFAPFWPSVAWAQSRVIGNKLLDAPVTTSIKLAALAATYAGAKGLATQAWGQGDKKKYRWYEIPLPYGWTWSLGWIIPYAGTGPGMPKSWSDVRGTARSFVPMAGQGLVTLGTQMNRYGKQLAYPGTKQPEAQSKQNAAVWRQTFSDLFPGLFGQYWMSLYENSQKPSGKKQPWAAQAITGPTLGIRKKVSGAQGGGTRREESFRRGFSRRFERKGFERWQRQR